jgi:cysteine synthase A
MNLGRPDRRRAILEAAERRAVAAGRNARRRPVGNTLVSCISSASAATEVIVMPTPVAGESRVARTLGADVRIVMTTLQRSTTTRRRPHGWPTVPNAVWGGSTTRRTGRLLDDRPEIWQQTSGEFPRSSVRQVRRYARRRIALSENLPRRCAALADHSAARSTNGSRPDAQSEGPRRDRGIGIGRVTANLEGAPIDDAVRIEDPEIVRTVYRLLNDEGLFLGGTSGVNVAAAVRVAQDLGPGHTVVTVLCDGGAKYLSRLYNREWLAQKGLAYQGTS